MTLISTIITQAYRESNMLPLGKVATTLQVTEALQLLNSTFYGIYGSDAGETLQPWPLGNYGRQTIDAIQITNIQIQNPPQNRRLIATNLAPLRVYMTPSPDDGSRMEMVDPFGRLATFPVTLDGNGRPFASGALEVPLNVMNVSTTFMYRADLGYWVQVTGKVETDEMPFPVDFDDMFMILLAMRLNSRYGRMIDDQSIATLKNQRMNFRARYVQSAPLEINDDISWPFMSTQSYDNSWGYSSVNAFNRGIQNP